MTTSARWTLEELIKLNREQVVDLFRTLEAPALEELTGEFTGHVPDGGDPENRRRIDERMFNENSWLGYWLGKAYRVTGDNVGEGYNMGRRPDGRTDRFLRFGTYVGPSQIDGQPSIVMTYSSFNNPSGNRDLIDEIRKLSDGVYLGLGSARAEDGSRTRPGPFVLTGPIGEWVGVDDETAEAK
jgi:hypothetical protein